MEGKIDFIDTKLASRDSSDAMRMAIQCLGGAKSWYGYVTGLFGMIQRRFTIESTGLVEGSALVFLERLKFNDGEEQKREWRIFDTPEGLALEGEDVTLIRNGRIQDDALSFVYRVKFGSLKFAYRDIFNTRADGGVENIGYARFLGMPIMKVTACAKPN